MRRLPDTLFIPGLDQQGLVRYLAQQPAIIAAYLFGSWTAGRPRPDSDIDRALLLSPQSKTSVKEDSTITFELKMNGFMPFSKGGLAILMRLLLPSRTISKRNRENAAFLTYRH